MAIIQSLRSGVLIIRRANWEAVDNSIVWEARLTVPIAWVRECIWPWSWPLRRVSSGLGR